MSEIEAPIPITDKRGVRQDRAVAAEAMEVEERESLMYWLSAHGMDESDDADRPIEELRALVLAAQQDTYEAEKQAEEEERRIEAVTAFVVVLYPDGTAVASADLAEVPLMKLQREANPNDMWVGCSQVVRDIDKTSVVASLLNSMTALQQQAAQQVAQQRMTDRLRLNNPRR